MQASTGSMQAKKARMQKKTKNDEGKKGKRIRAGGKKRSAQDIRMSVNPSIHPSIPSIKA
jgi:hypothetical protein